MWWKIAGLAFAIAIVAACAPPEPSLIPDRDLHPQPADAVAILALEPFELGAEACDPESLAECVRRSILSQRPGLRVLSPEEFSRVAYPDLDVSEVPKQPEYISLLLEDAEFRARIAPLRLRYLVVVGGLSTTRQLWDHIYCGGGYGGAGCLGAAANEKETRMAATVFDLVRIGELREVTASRRDQGVLVVFVIFPFYRPAITVSEACREVAHDILMAMDELGQPEPWRKP